MSHASEDQGGSSVLSESGESSRGGANREAVHPARPAAGLSRRDLIPGAPLEFHRHVLSHVLYDGAGEETLAARHVPTEIVRASGAIAIGIPATILAEDFAAPSHDNADGGSDTQAVPGTRRRREELSEEDRLDRLLRGPLIVYTTETPASKTRGRFRRAFFGLLGGIVVQLALISKILFFGGSASWPVAWRGSEPLSVPSKVVYVLLGATHLLAAAGAVAKSPLLLTVHEAILLAGTAASVPSNLRGTLDVVVVGCSVGIGYFTSQLRFLMTPHALFIKPAAIPGA
eukprot:GHVT01032752.1.p1 GENE.GHVT01032752.1~~GHVT01032752.1.p1  ORF type:complete len:287 (-),score=38.58 GHVT01032752.1:600-1460(-)